ncbi:hypothetical protein C8N46_103115 [Kordia periserrulae]|uniref:Uncharacterized protein n=1 Tax=Kordia periserrulae TaxID=701523 RepID=A0A2T6C199_9FLAO|nr:hypothetical protein [Kordia periserrulae]PTX62017.1 hypothetical protein C8N46_103115 [Kordia periserrulae]
MATSDPKPTSATPESTSTSKKKANPISKKQTANEPPKGISKGVSDETMVSFKRELENMLLFAMKNGKTIDTDINSLIESNNISDLINAHNILVKNIEPATPKSIAYLDLVSKGDDKKNIFQRLPMIRNLIILAVIFLLIFIGTSLSSEVNTTSLAKGVLSNSGKSLLLNMLFLCAISGLGVMFYLLRDISDGVRNATLMPEQSIYYVALIILGIISGLILSEIVSSYNSGKDLSVFNNAVLALIGGFSSDAIFSILQGIINRIKAIFQ